MDDMVLEEALTLARRRYCHGEEFEQLTRLPVSEVLRIEDFVGMLVFFWSEVYFQEHGDPARENLIYRYISSGFEAAQGEVDISFIVDRISSEVICFRLHHVILTATRPASSDYGTLALWTKYGGDLERIVEYTSNCFFSDLARLGLTEAEALSILESVTRWDEEE